MTHRMSRRIRTLLALSAGVLLLALSTVPAFASGYWNGMAQ